MATPAVSGLESRIHFDAGQLDPFFGNGGQAAVTFPEGSADVVEVVPLSDGRVYVAATLTPATGVRRFGVARFTSSGTLDTSFGINGWAIARIGSVDNIVEDMVVQPDGRIVVVGTAVNPPQDPPHFFETIDVVQVPITKEQNFAVVRFRTDGSFDQSFGKRGIKRVDVGKIGEFSESLQVDSFASDEAKGAILQSNGKLILAGLGALTELSGGEFIVETPIFSLVRLNTDGSIDLSYGPDGTGMNVIGGNEFNAMGLDSQGRLLVVGSKQSTTFEGEIRSSRSIRRFRTNGKLDPNYTGLNESTNNLFRDGAVQSDNKVLARGFDELVRFNANGSPDSGFASDAGDDGDDDTTQGAFALDQGGKIVFLASKSSGTLPATPTFFPVLRRLLANGTPDTSFGSGGVVENPSAPLSFGAARMAVNNDGSYIGLGGLSDDQGVLARFFRDDGPVAVLKVENINAPKSSAHPLTITYRDDEAIDLSTLDNRDVRVTKGNFVRYAKFAAILNNTDPRLVTVRYKLTAPGTVWDATDSGVYSVSLRTDQVADEDGNFASTPTLGSFRVSIPIVGLIPAKLASASPDVSRDTRIIDLVNAES